MQIIVNRDIPEQSLANLMQLGEVVFISSDGITYPAISGHPDVFFCQVNNSIIAAPNVPKEIIHQFNRNNIDFVEGNTIVGNSYPDTAHYNAVVTDNYLIHKLDITDSKILDYCSSKAKIDVKQAYTRCNLLPLKNDSFITSDRGIYKTLKSNNLECLFVDPQQILLPGFNNGFFGGTCGVVDNVTYIIGSLSKIKDGIKIHEFLFHRSYKIIELYSGPLFDGGSIFFIDNPSKT